jgi:hypothetical protein
MSFFSYLLAWLLGLLGVASPANQTENLQKSAVSPQSTTTTASANRFGGGERTIRDVRGYGPIIVIEDTHFREGE